MEISNVVAAGCNPKTLAHILNHCSVTIGAMRERHNTILSRRIRAVPPAMGNKFTKERVTGDPQGLKPDLVILNDASKRAVVMGITITFYFPENMDQGHQEGEVCPPHTCVCSLRLHGCLNTLFCCRKPRILELG